MRAAIALVLAACGTSSRPPTHERARVAPSDCQAVVPGSALRDLARVPGARVCLAPGRYQGPVVLAADALLWGPSSAVIDRVEGGTVVELGTRATLIGATIDGRGGVFDREDAAVRIVGDGARVEGVTITNAVFGVLAERVAHVTIRDNHVQADRIGPMGIRGDTIRLWETQDSVVAGNVVEGGRDVVVWYSSGNVVEDNRVSDARYGTHFMYSHHNHAARNHYLRDVVGVFVMYSHDVTLVDNIVRAAGGASGMAIGLKDSGNVTITGNVLVEDRDGIYVDDTPLQQDHTLTVSGNLFGRCDAAIVIHGRGERSRFEGNDFIENRVPVSVEGGADTDTAGIAWERNYWSDYTGYDLDGDDTGDIRYEVRSLEGDLVDRTPALAFFRGTPALAAAGIVTRLVPMYTPRALLVDPSPRMRPHSWEGLHAD